jgi:uncharacterized OB-fold protein
MIDERLKIDDPFSWPFWEAAANGRLLIQHCRGCGRHQFYPRPHCVRCGKDSLVWEPASGHGRVYSATTVHLKVVAARNPPYRVGIIELDEGVRILGALDATTIGIGDRVVFSALEAMEAPFLMFRSAPDQGSTRSTGSS